MDRFQELNIFIAVAEATGFAGAATRLGLTPPTVTRAVASLEARLGVKLFTRTTRYVRLTEAGEQYLQHARRITQALAEADNSAIGVHSQPTGNLTITAPVLFGKQYVTPVVLEYLKQFPDTEVSLVLLDRVTNLVEEGFDIAVRIGDLADSSMRGIAVGEVRRIVVASPGYLQDHGIPKTPGELKQHTIINVSSTSGATSWRFKHRGKSQSVRLNVRLNTSSNDSAIGAAITGFGLTQVLSYQVADALRTGELVTVLEKFELAPLPVSIVHREARTPSAKISCFVELAVEQLRQRLAA